MIDKLLKTLKKDNSPPSLGVGNVVIEKATKANKYFAENVNAPDTDGYLQSYATADLVFSCVSYIADIVSQLEFEVETKNKKNKKILDQYFTQPNEFQSFSDIIHLVIQSYLLSGNAYQTFEKVGTKFEGWVLNPAMVKIVPHPKKYIDGFIYADTIAYKRNEVIHFKNLNINDEYYGISFLASLIDPLTIEGYAVEDLKNFYNNSLIANGIFTSEYPLSQKQINELREQFKSLYSRQGSDRYGHLILPNDLKYQPIKLNPKDAMLIDSLKISESRVYKVFRLDKALLGDMQGSYANTIKESKKIFINNFIRPLMLRYTKTLEIFFRRVLNDENISITASYKNIPEISDALSEKIDGVKQAFSLGILSLNEARRELGYEELDGKYTDAHFSPSYLTGNQPTDLVTGEQVNFAPTNQQPKPQGSTNVDGGQADGVSRNN